MKIKIILLLLTGFLISCTNDDDTTTSTENPISGIWKMIDVSCECAPPNFQSDHIWNFNLSQNTVTVTNVSDEVLQILDDGTYPVVLQTNTVLIEAVEYDYYFEDGNLFLGDQPEADGPLIKFERE